jgi:NAD(P)-dependent dehydrogenase (short-subunit alcohol dehydrogenase family)
MIAGLISGQYVTATAAVFITALCVLLGITFNFVIWNHYDTPIKYKKVKDLASKIIALTGCDSGIGHLTLSKLLLQNRDCKVIAICLTEEGCKEAKRLGAWHTFQCDLSKSDDIERCSKNILTLCDGRLWAIIHNAGIFIPGFVDFLLTEGYRKCMEVNFFGIVHLNHQLMPCIKREGGRLVFISSISGITVLPGLAAYATSKHAIESFAKSIRLESGPWNTSVSIINPSGMRTSMMTSWFEGEKRTWNQYLAKHGPGLWSQEWPEAYVDNRCKAQRAVNAILEDPATVADAILHAVTAQCPKWRYLPGMYTI